MQAAVDGLGGLDLLVVNSGGPPPGTFAALDEEAWAAPSTARCARRCGTIRAALPGLRESERAAICVVLSVSVRAPLPGLVTSNAMRPGLNGLVKSLAAELAPGIRINGVAPGRIETERSRWPTTRPAPATWPAARGGAPASEATIPMGRYGAPDELGRVVTFLLSPPPRTSRARCCPSTAASRAPCPSRMRYACPCCGFLTLDEAPPGTFAICPVCFWEDDDVQFRHRTGPAAPTGSASSRRARASAGTGSASPASGTTSGRHGAEERP